MSIHLFSHRPGQLLLAAVCLASMVLAGAARPKAPDTTAGRPDAVINFTLATSYTAALEAVTNLGLQPADLCYEAAVNYGVHPYQWQLRAWDNSSPEDRGFVVVVTTLAPADWLARARALPGVSQIMTDPEFSCPAIPVRTPTNLFTPPAAQDTQVTFAPPVAYGAALQAMTGLGLQLTDPCYEAAIDTGEHPAWHPLGQQATFARSHTLTLSVTILAPDDWPAQVRALPGVIGTQNAGC